MTSKEQHVSQVLIFLSSTPCFFNLSCCLYICSIVLSARSNYHILTNLSTLMRVNLTLLLLISILFCYSQSKKQKNKEAQSYSLISDITRKSLVLTGQYFKITYLGINKDKPKTKYEVVVWGAGSRAMTYLPVRLSYPYCKTNINIVFVIDTGSPYSSLTDEAFNALHDACPRFEKIPNAAYNIRIQDYVVFAMVSNHHFTNINILGSDFLSISNATLKIHYEPYEVGYGNIKITPKIHNRHQK